MSASPPLRIASVPASHVYIRHLEPVEELFAAPDVLRLPDPPPPGARSTVSDWWPPVMLHPAWVRDTPGFDLMHVHFGFDAVSAAELEETLEAVHASGRPVVFTAHDLRNPHHDTPDAHRASLDVLFRHADAVITLTPGAAAEIRERWGREALVLPHPHVVGFDRMSRVAATRPRPSGRGAFRVGLHVKSIRASMNPRDLLPVLIAAVAEIDGGVLQVNGHHDVFDPDGAHYDAELAAIVREAVDAGTIDLRVHEFFTEDELWDYLESLDASVLPYRFGTHSGWLEACRDLGTAVIAPTCGFYAEQGGVLSSGAVFSYDNDERGLDADSLVRAVRAAGRAGAPAPVSVASRAAQRQEIAAAHARLYRELRS